MKNAKNWLWLLVFGSAWGVMELVAGEAIYRRHVPLGSVWLAVVAFLMLGAARGLVNKPGSSTLVGLVAMLLKATYAAPFYCHLLGIVFMGVAFDVMATALMKDPKPVAWQTLVTAATSAYAAYAAFAVTITYIAHYAPWVRGGTPKVLAHILVGGTLAAIAAMLVVPAGLKLVTGTAPALSRRPRWSFAGALACLAALWTLGGIIA